MSETEISIYGVVATIAFLWGAVLLARDAIRQNEGGWFSRIAKLLGWLAIPPLLAIVGFAAMMDPHGGDPVIATLRSISIFYIVGSLIFIISKLAREERR